MFLVEAKQAGIFEIRNLPQEQMGPIMGIARRFLAIADLDGKHDVFQNRTPRKQSGLLEHHADVLAGAHDGLALKHHAPR